MSRASTDTAALTSTVENYLKTILVEGLHRDDDLVPMGQIASALEVASGTVTAMVKTLADGGLVSYEPYSGVRLTHDGRLLATRVLRRHRLVELFLVEVMKMDWTEVHDEAERLEHAVSDRLVDRMDEMLGHPDVDPHGDPIPTAQGVMPEREYQTLLTCGSAPQRVVRVRDQQADFLRLVERRGLMPGSVLRLLQRDPAAETVSLSLPASGMGTNEKPADGTGERTVDLGFGAAAKILVEPA